MNSHSKLNGLTALMLPIVLVAFTAIVTPSQAMAQAASQGCQAGQSQGGASGASAAMAAALLAACMATQPPNIPLCIMAAMAAAQAGESASEQAGSNQNCQHLQTAGGGGGNPGPTTPGSSPVPTPSFGPPGGTAGVTEAVAKHLQGTGVSVSPDGKTVTLPDGSTAPSSAMVDPSQASSHGISDAQLAAANSALSSAQQSVLDKMKAAGLASGLMDGAGGAGGGGGGAGESGGRNPAGAGFGFNFGKKGDGNKKSLAGMSKKFGDARIGVAADNIFEMVTRRYKARDAVDNFLKK